MKAPARSGLIPLRSGNRRSVGGRNDHRSLGRDVDQIAAAGGVAPEQGNERADGGLRSRPAVRLRLAHPQRHPVGFAGERHRPAGGHQFDVGSPPILARSDAAERRDDDNHQPRKTAPQGIGIERFAGRRRCRRQQADIGLGKEFLDLRLIGRLRRVEIEDAFVDVEGAPVGPRAIARRRFELDDIGAEIGEDPSGKPAQLVRRINDDHPCQQHGRGDCFLLLRSLLHRCSTLLV